LPAAEILPVTGRQVVRRLAPTMVHLIRRRNAWRSAAELERSVTASRHIGEAEMAKPLRWLRSYTVREDDGTLGSVCLYQSIDAETLAEHAMRAGMPADEIAPVIGRIVYRDDIDASRIPSYALI